VPAERRRDCGGSAGILETMRLTAAIAHEGDLYVARCLEVEVSSQGRSIDEARANLAEALALYFEGEPLDHIRCARPNARRRSNGSSSGTARARAPRQWRR